MNKFKDSLIKNIQEHPKRYLLISLLLFFSTVPGLLLLKEDYSYRIWYSESDPLLQTFDEFEKKFGNDDNLIIGLYNEKGLYNPKSMQMLHNLTNDMWKVESIVRVDSLTNFDYVSTEGDEIDVAPLIDEDLISKYTQSDIDKLQLKINNHEFIEGNYISKDGKLAVVVAQIQPSYEKIADNTIITTQARELVKKYSDDNHELQITGTSVLTHMFKEATEEDIAMLLPFVYLIFTIVLWFIYRRKSGILIPYLIITVSILMMMGTSGLLGQKINALSGVAPNILLTVAIADTIHILTVYFFGLRQGFSNSEAVTYTLNKNFYPTLLTSITTAVGFFSFGNAKIGPIANMGISVGFGVFYAWLCTYMIVGPILQLMPKLSKRSNQQENSILDAEAHIKVTNKTKRFVNLIYKQRFLIVLTSIVMTIGAIVLAGKFLVVNLDPYTQFPYDHKFNKDNRKVEKHLGPLDNINFMIYAAGVDKAKDPDFLKTIEKFEIWLNEQDYISSTFSINDILKDLNKTLNGNSKSSYVIPETQEEIGQELLFYSMGLPPGRDLNNRISMNNDSVHLVANWSIHTSREANEKMEIIKAKGKELGLDMEITGKVPLFHDLTPYVVTSFLESFTLAFVLITTILIIVLKSWRLGFLALVPNLFPLIIGSAVYGMSGEYVDMASVLIASVCLGIAVDDSIHFLFEYKKYREINYSPSKTIELIFTNTAPSLINTTFIIVLGFGSFYFANYVPNAKFGVMVAIILTIALIADLILLPAILMLNEKEPKNA